MDTSRPSRDPYSLLSNLNFDVRTLVQDHCVDIVSYRIYFELDIEQGGVHKALLIKQEIARLRGSSSTWFQTSCYRRAELNSKIMNTLLYYYFVRSGTIHSPSIRNQSSKSKVLSTQLY